jgi:hypothetical protein
MYLAALKTKANEITGRNERRGGNPVIPSERRKAVL